MEADDWKQAWQAQPQGGLTVDTQRLLEEVRRDQRRFARTIFWRDVREAGIALLMAPLWAWMGIRQSLPWTWHLMIPSLLGVAGFLLIDRLRHRRPPPSSESLRRHVEASLAEVEHQIWLLRNVFWWYLAPLALPMLAFFAHCAWLAKPVGWWTAAVALAPALLGMAVFAAIYFWNQSAVRTSLAPRRDELQALLASLSGETLADQNPPGEKPD